MSARVATHVALHAERSVASLEGALKRCDTPASVRGGGQMNEWEGTYDVRLCDYERGSDTDERGIQFFSIPDAQSVKRGSAP